MSATEALRYDVTPAPPPQRWDQLCASLTAGPPRRVVPIRAPSAIRSIETPTQIVTDRWAQPLPYRCAEHCDYGDGPQCTHPQSRTTVDAARARGGACGPEARYMTVKGVPL